MKQYTLGLYEKAMPNELPLREKLDTAARCGFDRLELSVDESEEKLSRLKQPASWRRDLAVASLDAGVPISTLCLSGHRKYPLGSHDPAVRRRSLEILQDALALGAEIGVQLIQLAGYDVYYEPGDEDTRRWFLENLERSTEMAAAFGITLGFETMETPFMDTTQKAMDYVTRVNSPYLGVYPDIGNLKNAAVLYNTSVTDDLKFGQGHIFAAHLKETRPGVYRDMTFGSGGHTEYTPCIQALWSQGVRLYTGEFWYHPGEDYVEQITAAARFLRGKIQPIAGESYA